ncbi:MAG TPA: DUF423 domain-containing protein [Stellaceae bacterium]|nr:DUF423 domain-containing protein [Stellaceae bacterium]
MRRALLILAGLNGLAAVSLGAAAQHLWAGDAGARALVETGVRYGLSHAAICVALAAFPVSNSLLGRRLQAGAALSLAIGTTLFCGGLYALAAGLGAATPLVPTGGSLMILGWILLLGWSVVSTRRA